MTNIWKTISGSSSLHHYPFMRGFQLSSLWNGDQIPTENTTLTPHVRKGKFHGQIKDLPRQHSSRLGHRSDFIALSPLEVMTGFRSDRPLLQICPTLKFYRRSNARTSASNTSHFYIYASFLREKCPQRSVEHLGSLLRERASAAHNRATNIFPPSIEVFYFVLVRRTNYGGCNLRFRWFGPCRVRVVYGQILYLITLIQDGILF